MILYHNVKDTLNNHTGVARSLYESITNTARHASEARWTCDAEPRFRLDVNTLIVLTVSSQGQRVNGGSLQVH